MSFHDESSEVSLLNREAFRRPIAVHDWTWQVLKRSEDFAVRSGGAFDITIAPLLSQWGYLPIGYLTDKSATYRDIILGPNQTVRFARPLALDLGGIAKGFAVDCAVKALRTAGFKNGTVNAGGDLRTFGKEPQKIYLRDPETPGNSAGVVLLQNRAIATSGVYFSRKLWHGGSVSPLIDPETDQPFVDEISVAVAAPDCVTADALTKIVLVQREEARTLLNWYDADAVILERGQSPRVLADDTPQFRKA